MDLELRGKHALVTGSTAGTGEGVALALAAEGASVVSHGRNECEAHRVASHVEHFAPAAIVLGDLSDEEATTRVADEALRAFGGIDILDNNALAYGGTSWFDVTPDEWA